MDFYGVGDVNILGAIDLDSLHVELAVRETRSADGVRSMIRDRILFRHGTPQSLLSDHAREFVGKTMARLAADFGFRQISTGGYNARGNSVIESFWQFVGICLRSMTDEQYANVRDHVQAIAWAWNTTMKKSTSVSPFEVMTGMLPRTAPGSAFVSGSGEGSLDVSAIRAAAAEYQRIAKAHADYMRKVRRDYLNARGRKLKEIDVGDYVKIYMPPAQGAVEAQGRKAKHFVQFRGPLRVTAKPSSSTLELECYFRPRNKYMRHVSNVRRWIGPLPSRDAQAGAAEQSPVVMSADVEVGDFVLVCEDDVTQIMDLAKVVSIDDACVTVHCWGTTAANPRSGKFRPVFVTKGGQTRFRKQTGAKPWQWDIKTSDFPALVAAHGLSLRSDGRLSAPSARVVPQLLPKVIKRFR